MIRHKITCTTSIRCAVKYEGETIEQKIARIMNNKEPITDGAPIIYMERKEGVNPDFDIRTDRFDAALDAMDIVAKAKIAQREARMKPKKDDKKSDASAESIQGTEPSGQTA